MCGASWTRVLGIAALRRADHFFPGVVLGITCWERPDQRKQGGAEPPLLFWVSSLSSTQLEVSLGFVVHVKCTDS